MDGGEFRRQSGTVFTLGHVRSGQRPPRMLAFGDTYNQRRNWDKQAFYVSGGGGFVFAFIKCSFALVQISYVSSLKIW